MRTKRPTIPFVLFFTTLVVISATAMPTPTEQVKETVNMAIETLKDGREDQAIRREKVSSAIRKRFDFRVMSQRTLATNWKKATPEQKSRFIVLFSDILEQTYMERIEAYTDERVEYVKERVKGDKALVDTIIVTKSADIPIRYKLLRNGDEWLVFDVVIEEVSLIRNYRSSYAEIVKKEGIDGLLARMEEKVKK